MTLFYKDRFFIQHRYIYCYSGCSYSILIVLVRMVVIRTPLPLKVSQTVLYACFGDLNPRFLVKGTVTRFCPCAATWFLFRRTVFQDWRLVKKSYSTDPETPEKAIISVFKSYLVHLGSFKRHILYFCASIIEKIRSHWGEPYEAKFVVVSVPTNGSNVAFNVVIWLSSLSIKVLQSTIYLWRIFFKR